MSGAEPPKKLDRADMIPVYAYLNNKFVLIWSN